MIYLVVATLAYFLCVIVLLNGSNRQQKRFDKQVAELEKRLNERDKMVNALLKPGIGLQERLNIEKKLKNE